MDDLRGDVFGGKRGPQQMRHAAAGGEGGGNGDGGRGTVHKTPPWDFFADRRYVGRWRQARLLKSASQAPRAAVSCRATGIWRKIMRMARLIAALLISLLTCGFAAAQTRITIAVGGGACLCYLPNVLAKQLGEYDKAGLAVELVDLKGGSDALKAVLGGSADVV